MIFFFCICNLMSRLWRWRRSLEQRGSAELLVSHQEDKMHFDIFAILAVPLTSSSNDVVCQDLATGWSAPCWMGSWGRWRTTWPASRRCSATSSTPSPPLLARQTTPPQPPFLLHTWTKSLPSGHRFFLGSTLLHGNNPRYPPPSSKIPTLLLFKATVHSLYNHRNVILTAHVFHRISNCSYMLSIVFCSGRIL